MFSTASITGLAEPITESGGRVDVSRVISSRSNLSRSGVCRGSLACLPRGSRSTER
jgi:hypothetical protein